jgi:hypothetical protein
MAKTKETPLPVTSEYLALLDAAIGAVPGKQEGVARLTGLNQGTISRTLSSGRATYTTLDKLSRALRLPAPVVMIRDREHAKWCQLGALLLKHNPTTFAQLIGIAENHARLAGLSEDRWFGDPHDIKAPPEEIDRLKSVIVNPLRTKHRRTDRRS